MKNLRQAFIPGRHRAALGLVAFICLLSACAGRDFNRGEYIRRGAEAIEPFKRDLMAALTEALKGGGGDAIDVCRLRAPELAAQASGDKLKVGRTSHKLRNPANAPKPWMADLLEEYAAGDGKSGPEAVALPGGGVGYVEPIYVKTMCLGCHGENVPEPIQERIREYYPDDRAVGFEEGDFRGLFWVEFQSDD